MPDDNAFTDLIRRVRAGDEQAATTLVQQYEPEIRTEVRLWLRRRYPQLRRALDSMDICQAVLASFFIRAAAGQYQLDRPDQLIRLLVSMARHKLSEQAKYHQSQRRDIRRVQSLTPEHGETAVGGDSPSEVVSNQELLQQFHNQLSEEERQIMDLRAEP
jgi:RNA polymerase sigma-70 factor (ECF subfamily)